MIKYKDKILNFKTCEIKISTDPMARCHASKNQSLANLSFIILL